MRYESCCPVKKVGDHLVSSPGQINNIVLFSSRMFQEEILFNKMPLKYNTMLLSQPCRLICALLQDHAARRCQHLRQRSRRHHPQDDRRSWMHCWHTALQHTERGKNTYLRSLLSTILLYHSELMKIEDLSAMLRCFQQLNG